MVLRKSWTSANKLLPSLDAAVYKHVIPGPVFLKYVSDAFEERQEELRSRGGMLGLLMRLKTRNRLPKGWRG